MTIKMTTSVRLKGMTSPLSSTHIIPSHNPIQLAAISNYKLAQLTFAPPDLHSLRKTAVIKNMIETVYSSTPAEWLQQMTRWQYFTPESLEEMTQEGLEEIFNQYAQTIEAFRPIKSNDNSQDHFFDGDEEEEDEEDGQGDDLWIAEDEVGTTSPNNIALEEESKSKTNSVDSTTSSIFSQPNSTISNESFVMDPKEKPLPDLVIKDDYKNRRKSGNLLNNNSNPNRLSWTSDTGITSSVVSQNLANEIMSLFDMDFAIDIKVNTAPKLPELSFNQKKRKSQQLLNRQSQDMLTTLLPAFDKIQLEHSLGEPIIIEEPTKPFVIKSVPARSSSLRHRQEIMNVESEKTIPKKKSLLKLASLITHTNKKKESDAIIPSERITSTSTLNSISSSTSSSSWISTEPVILEAKKLTLTRPQKPLPDPPTKRNSRKKSVTKRKSNTFEQDKLAGLSRSKSTFNKIGGGLKAKKQVRRTSSAKNFTEYHKDEQAEEVVSPTSSFVKRMTSFNWKIKNKHKPIVV